MPTPAERRRVRLTRGERRRRLRQLAKVRAATATNVEGQRR